MAIPNAHRVTAERNDMDFEWATVLFLSGRISLSDRTADRPLGDLRGEVLTAIRPKAQGISGSENSEQRYHRGAQAAVVSHWLVAVAAAVLR